MKSPYWGSIRTWSVLSGAGAYCQPVSNLSFAIGRAPCSVPGEIIGRLVDAGALLLELHQHVVDGG